MRAAASSPISSTIMCSWWCAPYFSSASSIVSVKFISLIHKNTVNKVSYVVSTKFFNSGISFTSLCYLFSLQAFSISSIFIFFPFKFHFVFSVLSVANMRCRFVHCPTTLATLILSIFGVFIAVFLIAHIQTHFSNSQ